MEKFTGTRSTPIAGQLPTEEMNPKDTSSPKISHVVLSNFSATLKSLGEKLDSKSNTKWMIGRIMKGPKKGKFTLRKKGFATFWARLTGNVDFKHLANDTENDGLKEVLDRFVSSTDPLDEQQRGGELNLAVRLLRGRFRQIGRRLISNEAKVGARNAYSDIFDQVLSGDTTGISAADLQQIAQDCLIDFEYATTEQSQKEHDRLANKALNKPAPTTPYDIKGLKHLNALHRLLEKQGMTEQIPSRSMKKFEGLRRSLTTSSDTEGTMSLVERFDQEQRIENANIGSFIAKWKVKYDAAEAICAPGFKSTLKRLKMRIDALELLVIQETISSNIKKIETNTSNPAIAIRAIKEAYARLPAKVKQTGVSHFIMPYKDLQWLQESIEALAKPATGTEAEMEHPVERGRRLIAIAGALSDPEDADQLITLKAIVDEMEIELRNPTGEDIQDPIQTSSQSSRKSKRTKEASQALNAGEMKATLKTIKRNISEALSEERSHFEKHIRAIKEAYARLPAGVKEAGVSDFIKTYKDLELVKDLVEPASGTTDEMEHAIDQGKRLIAIAQALSNPADADQLTSLKTIVNEIEIKLINALAHEIQDPSITSAMNPTEIESMRRATNHYSSMFKLYLDEREPVPEEISTALLSNTTRMLNRCESSESSESDEIKALARKLEMVQSSLNLYKDLDIDL